jgi:hypothetical protein
LSSQNRIGDRNEDIVIRVGWHLLGFQVTVVVVTILVVMVLVVFYFSVSVVVLVTVPGHGHVDIHPVESQDLLLPMSPVVA